MSFFSSSPPIAAAGAPGSRGRQRKVCPWSPELSLVGLALTNGTLARVSRVRLREALGLQTAELWSPPHAPRSENSWLSTETPGLASASPPTGSPGVCTGRERLADRLFGLGSPPFPVAFMLR